MAIFNDELIDDIAPVPEFKSPPLATPTRPELNMTVNMGGFENYGQAPPLKSGLSLKELSGFSSLQGIPSFNSSNELITKGELIANQRYPMYKRGVDLENVYGLQQGAMEQLGNGLAKMVATGIGTFAQSFATTPNTIKAIKNGSLKELSGSPDGYEAAIDDWLKNIEDFFPNYVTKEEREHPWRGLIPFRQGSANFWGDKIIKNIGFTIGAIGGALVQDLAIGAVTGGIGEIPLVASQIGKASLALNKIFAVGGKIEDIFKLTGTLKKGEQGFLKLEQLYGAAQAVKLSNGFRYGMNLYGASRTEAAIEARDGYQQTKKELTRLYKLDNFGDDPTGDDLKLIEDYSINSMNTRFGINMALLTVSNAIQFDNLFRSFSTASGKGIQGSLIKSLETPGGKIKLAEGSLDVFEREAIKGGVKQKAWNFVKPKLALMFSEGIYEEGGQFAAEKGTYDYFTRKYKDPSKGTNTESWNSLEEMVSSTVLGLNEQFGSQEGMENMVIGAISALITGGGMSQIDKMKGRGTDKILQNSINTINQYGVTGILDNKYTDTAESLVIAKNMKAAAKAEDIYAYNNLKHELFFKFVNSRSVAGMHDVTVMQLELLKDLKKEDFEQKFGMDFTESNKETVVEYVDALIKQANQIEKTAKGINETFKNPFKSSINPKSSEEKIEAAKYKTFELWKLELGYFAAVQEDTKKRVASMGTTLGNINPLLSVDIASKLSNKKDLVELSASYEEKANKLIASISTESTTEYRRATKAQIKALRTAGEKINLMVKENGLTAKGIQDIFNFELNNQLPGEDILSVADVVKVHALGVDIEKLSWRSKHASEIIDLLTSEKGFDGYFDSAAKVKPIVDEEEVKQEGETPTETESAVVPKFKNNLGVDQDVEEGREYKSSTFKKAVVRKSGDRYKITAPDGSVTFQSTKEKAMEEAEEVNANQNDLSRVSVIAVNPDGTIKVQDLAGNIQNISVAQLAGYSRIETKQDRLLKNQEDLTKDQDELDLKSPTIPTKTSIGEGTHNRVKDAFILYTSSTTESEGRIPEGGSAPHITRAREFFADIDMFDNRGDMRAILVTPHTVEALGLEGIVQMSYGVTADTDINTIKDVNDINLGWVAQVFVVQEKGKTYFVDKNGKKLTQIGKKADLGKVIFQTMPTTEIEYKDKTPRYRKGQEKEALAHSKAWAEFRKDLFASSPKAKPGLYTFSISRGIPEENLVNGADGILRREKNPVSKVLVTQDIIENHEGLIAIPTTTTLTDETGELVTFENGIPVLKYGSILQRLNNKQFNTEEATLLYEVIKETALDLVEQSENNQVLRINRDYETFLRNILYWKKGKTQSPNQIRIKTETMSFEIGDESYPLAEIEEYRTAIIDQLRKAYNNVNNITLKSETFNDPFVEYKLNGKGELSTIEWKNYQTYLLSDINPEGSARTNIPLTTSVAKRTESVPYSYKQKYSILHSVGLKVEEIAQEPLKPNTPTPQNPNGVSTVIIDGHLIDGFTDNTYTKFSGEVNFSADFDANGGVIATITPNSFTKSISEDQGKMEQVIDPILKQLGLFNSSESPHARVITFLETKIEVDLNAQHAATNPEKGKNKPAEPSKENDNKKRRDLSLASIEQGKLNRASDTYPVTATLYDNKGNSKTISDSLDVVTKGDQEWRIKETINKYYDDELAGPKTPKVLNKKNQELLAEAMRMLNPEIQSFIKEDIQEGDFESAIMTLKRSLSQYEKGEEFLKKYDIEDIVNNLTGETEVKEKPETPIAKEPAPLNVYVEDHTKFQEEDDNNVPFRKIGVNDSIMQDDKDIEIFREWTAEYVPLIPYEILLNVITTQNGEKAWGVFENKIVKFVYGGLRGTEYHEVFEAIWKGMLSEEQRQAILDEFRQRKGQFTDRQSGKKIDYIDATDYQIKERIADDFSDYRVGKLPARSLGEKIRRWFKAILDFFKSFSKKPNLKKELFEAINTGKFKNIPFNPNVDYSKPEYSLIAGLTPRQTHDLIQDMLARSAGILYANGAKKLLYTPEGVTSAEMFWQIENQYKNITDGLGFTRRSKISDAAWKELTDRVKIGLRALGVTFNEADQVNINEDAANNREYAQNSFTTDWKKASSGALKFSLATLLQTVASEGNNLGLPLPAPLYTSGENSIRGYQLMNFSRVFATLLDKLSNTSSIYKAVEKIIDLANYDSNYVRLYSRLGGSVMKGDDGEIIPIMPFETFDHTDWRYFIQFVQTFTKQKPDALIQYKSNGEVYTAPANLYTAIKNLQDKWLENVKALALEKDSFIKLNRSQSPPVYEVKSFRATIETTNNGTYRVISPTNEIKNYNTKAEATQAAKKANIPIGTPRQQIAFLKLIGVEFDYDVYKRLKSEKFKGVSSQQVAFAGYVSSLYQYFGENKGIMTINNKTLSINGPLSGLAELMIKATNPNQDSTHYGVDGQRMGSFTDNNYASVFENEFNEADTLDELLEVRPELRDLYNRGSQVLKPGGLFFDINRKRIKNVKVSYIDGTKEVDKNKGTSTITLSKGERFTQEINQNLDGNYYIMIPADGSTEWMMNMGNNIKFNEIENGKAWTKEGGIYSIFRGYLEDDIALALDTPNREHLKNLEGRGRELRFFKDILYKKNLDDINALIARNATQAEFAKYIKNNVDDINASIKEGIDDFSEGTFKILTGSKQVISYTDGKKIVWAYPGLVDSFSKKHGFDKNVTSEKVIRDLISYANVNYIINNMEYHKVLFGDPYQFVVREDGSLEETKRLKSWFSPRRTTFDSVEFNNFLNDKLNTVNGIKLKKGMPGYHKFKSYINTATYADIVTAGSLSNLIQAYSKNKETDGMSWLMDTTYREMKLKNGQWDLDGNQEAWHQWQMAYTRKHSPYYDYKNDKGVINEALLKHDNRLLSTKEPKHTIEILKPIVTGNKSGKNQFEQVLDKFSQMPIYYSMVQGTNLEALYHKMMKEEIGYVIVESGRKVGAEKLDTIYKGNGQFNNDPFNNNIKVTWKSYGTQVETASDGKAHEQTRGSQLTKMVSIDLFENGEAIGLTAERQLEIQKLYDENKDILDRLHQNAYSELLKKIGVVDNGDGYFSKKDGKAVSETLMYEMMRRQLSENVIDTIKLEPNNQFKIPFEASPAYIQIRNILYSLIDKAVGRSIKMSGGPHVQVPSTMFEPATEGRTLMMRDKDGQWGTITREEYETLSEEERKKVVLTDDTLKFYTEDDPYCEIMLPHWFGEKLSKMITKDGKRISDKALLAYLDTPVGREILRGVGFRIPTQALSSVEVFRVKGFLPQYMGATVVVPSSIVIKSGGDFDIDKLNMYLKSIWIDNSGEMHIIESQGSEEATKKFYGDLFDKGELLSKKQLGELDEFLLEAQKTGIHTDELMHAIFGDGGLFDIEEITDEFIQTLIDQGVKTAVVNEYYRKALENEYYRSLEKLLTLPENFSRLIAPIDDAGLKELATHLNKLKGYDESKIKNRLLNRNYMTSLRHSFAMGKKWIGVVAVSITTLSLKQKSKVYIDPDKAALLSDKDRMLLGDLTMFLPHNTVNVNDKEYISLSGRTVKDSEELISSRLSGYGTAVVDVAKDDFITSIIESDLVIGMFMFLENVGTGGEWATKFMHQPIISRYLEMLDADNTANLFNENKILAIKSKFVTTDPFLREAELSLDSLENNISKYYNNSLTEKENAEQHKILDEFLKYAKMAEHNFMFSQAINYDTMSIKSAESLTRKQLRTEIAERENIITSANNILSSTSIGEQARMQNSAVNAMGEVLRLDSPAFRYITDKVLKKYGANQYLSGDKYERIALQVKAAFLDYLIQTKSNIESKIPTLLLGEETNIAAQLEKIKVKYPNLKILEDFEAVSGSRIDGAKSMKLGVNLKEAYDENLYIGYMRELRDYNEETRAFYDSLVDVSVLQGTYASTISLRNIIPLEDFSALIAPYMDALQATEDLNAFTEGYFERNNFNSSDVWGSFSPKFFEWNNETPVDEQITKTGEWYADIYQYKSFLFPSVPSLSIQPEDRNVMLVSEKWNAFDLRYDFLKVNRVVVDKWTGDAVDMATGRTITKMSHGIMKEKGDPSLKDVYGYKKVKYNTGEPLIVWTEYKGEVTRNHVYKLVNLYGDGARAVEHPANLGQTVIDNGTIRVEKELSDEEIVNAYGGQLDQKELSLQEKDLGQLSMFTDKDFDNKSEFNKLPGKSDTPTMTYAGIGSRETPADVLVTMTKVAKYLQGLGYTLRSGAAIGADTAFEKGAENKKEIFKNINATDTTRAIAKEIHQNANALGTGFILDLMARNTNQIFGKDLNIPVDFVLAWTPLTREGKVVTKAEDRVYYGKGDPNNTGGTGQAIAMASLKGIPVINMASPDWKGQLVAIIGKPQKQISKAEEVYSKLGNVTRSEHVEIVEKPFSYSDEQKKGLAVVAYKSTKMPASFENPFHTSGKSTKENVISFIDFVLNSNEPQAQWMREQMKSGKFKGKKIYYGNTRAAKENQPSHATAIDYLINKYNWETQKQEVKIEEKETPKNVLPLQKPTAQKSNKITADDIEFAVREAKRGILTDNKKNGERIDLGMSIAEIRAGKKALLNGRTKSVTAERVTRAIKEARARGYYDYIVGTGGHTGKIQVPVIEGDPDQVSKFDLNLNPIVEPDWKEEDNKDDECNVPF